MPHKSGFVNIIGNPNVGKSTLMNALVGEKLSIITSKAQTTRHRIMGIVNGDDFQIVYSDTPGIINPHYKLQEAMMKFVESAFADADILLYVVEFGEKPSGVDPKVLERLKDSGIPVILVINKIDKSEQAAVEAVMKEWSGLLPMADIIPASALHSFNLDKVFGTILDKLPESPPYYPKDELTDRTMRFFVSEMIREKILLLYQKEIPYSCEVSVEEFREKEDITHIMATVHVARESQKMILIGKNGSKIKELGTQARKDIEDFIQGRVYLDLSIKVSKDWRENATQLKRFGYEG